MFRIDFTAGGTELLDTVKPLWERLNAHHKSCSEHFEEIFAKRVFQERVDEWMAESVAAIRVDLAKDRCSGRCVGYCVSTIKRENAGEIDSLYIEPDYRRQGVGEKLMNRAIEWLDENKTTTKKIVVAGGNENAIPFYNKFGFYTRRIVLEQVTDNHL